MGGKGSAATKSLMILSIAGIVAKLLSVFYVPFLRVILGGDGVGIYSRGYDIFMFAYAVTTMGCQPAVAKIVAELRVVGNEKDAVKTLKISRKMFGKIGLIVTLVIMAIAYPYTKYCKIESTLPVILILAPSVFLTAVLAAYRGYFQGKGNMTGIAISQVLEQILNVALSLLFAYIFVHISIPLGSAGATIGTSVGALIGVIYLIRVYERKHYEREALKYPGEKPVKAELIRMKLIRYAFPITLSAAIQNLGGVVDMTNVNLRLLHAGFTPIMADTLYGYLYYYRVLIGVPLIIITAIGTIILPAISEAYVVRDKKTIVRNVNFAMRVTLAITIPGAIGLSILSKDIYVVLFGGQGYKLMMYGSVILIFMALAQVLGVALQGISKFYPMIISFTIGIVVKIVANFVLVGIPWINIYGVLIGNFLWYAIPTVLNYLILRKAIKAKIPFVKSVIRPAIAGAVMGGVLIVVKLGFNIIENFIGLQGFVYDIYVVIMLIIMVGIGALVYGYIMAVIGGIRKADIESLSPKAYRILPGFFRRKLK